MIYRQIPRIGIELSVIGQGGHEYLADGQLRGFQEDFAVREVRDEHAF